MSQGQPNQPSIVALVKSAVADARALAQAQAALAQAELKQTGQQVGKTGGLFIGAAFMGFLGFVFLLVTLAWVLVALGLPYWAGFGIVALLLLIVTAVLGLLGKRSADGIKGPERSIAELERTKAALAGPVSDALPPGVIGSEPAASGLHGAPIASGPAAAGGTPSPGA